LKDADSTLVAGLSAVLNLFRSGTARFANK
jgi:hypothetical protein